MCRNLTGLLRKGFFLVPLLALILSAHAQVTVSVLVKPPYSSHIIDYGHLENKAVITLMNTTGTAQQVKLGGSLTNDAAGLSISTTRDYSPSSPILLGPHATVTLVANADAMRFLDESNITTNAGEGVKERMFRTGLLPEGMYRLCLDAYDFNSGTMLSTPGAGCFSFNISLAQPPVITYPFNGQTVPKEQKAVNFSWTPAMGNLAGGAVLYDLVVAEVHPGQNQNDAINAAREFKAGNPPIYRTNLPSQLYVRQPADLPFEAGHTYAVQVIARDANKRLSFLNAGQSEVVVFTYGVEDKPQATPAVRNPTTPVKGFTPRTGPLEQLEKYSFKGKLVWAFLKSEVSKSALSQAGPKPGFTDISFEQTAEGLSGAAVYTGTVHGNSAAGPGKKPAPGNSGAFTGGINMFGGGITEGALLDVGNAMGAVLSSKTYGETMLNEQNEKQDNIDKAAADEKYPMAFTKVTLVKVIDPDFLMLLKKNKDLNPFGNQQLPPSEAVIGTATTDINGNYKLDYYGEVGIGYYIQLRVNDYHFDFVDKLVPIKEDTYGTYDLGTLTGLANTYRLKINVKDPKGKDISNASVKILRTKGFYTSPKTHVNLALELQRAAGKGGQQDIREPKGYKQPYGKPALPESYELAASGKPGDKFFKAFYNDGYSDRYLISITGEGFEDFQTDLVVDGYNYNVFEGSVLDLVKTYTIKPADPAVKGRLVAKNGGVAVKDAKVIVHPAEDDYLSAMKYDHAWSAKSDKEGLFLVEGIPVSDKPYHITVLYQGKPYEDTKDMFLNAKGIVENRDPMEVDVALVVVCGRVVDGKNNPVDNATLHWKTGGQNFWSDGSGNFMTAQSAGKHVLVAQKKGYKDTEITIDVESKGIVSGTNATDMQNAGLGVFQGVLGGNLFQGGGNGNTNNPAQGAAGANAAAGAFGYMNFENGVSGTAALMSDAAAAGTLFSGSSSCGNTIVMKGFCLKAIVRDDATNAPITGAKLSSGDKPGVATNSNGVAFIEGVPVGSSLLVAEGPANGFYATVQVTASISGAKDTTGIEIRLKAGSKASGVVMAAGSPVEGATVSLSGNDYITTKTDKKGQYTLSGLPAGECSVRAAKSGFIAETKKAQFAAGKLTTLDFALKDPGFNAASLLGFKLVLSESKAGSAPDEFIISGELTELPDNNVFALESKSAKLAFHERTVTRKGNNIYPKDAEMQLDAAEIGIRFFDIFHGKLKGSNLKLRPKADNKEKGEIAGDVLFDLADTYEALSDWNMPAEAMKLKLNGSTRFGAITSDKSSPGSSYALTGVSGGWSIYNVNFEPDLENSKLEASGLYFKGKLSIDGIAGLGKLTIQADEVKIGSNGAVKSVKLSVNPKPELSLAGTWKVKISDVGISQFGLKFSGNMDVPVTGSATASIGVSNMVVSKNGISGGSFHLPETGMDVFGVTSFKASDPLSLQSVPGSDDFKLTGAGGFKLPQYIADNIAITNFSMATNGDFYAATTAGFTTDFGGLAKLTVKNIGIGNSEFNLDCNIGLNIPKLGLDAAGHIHYKKGSVTVDKLHTDFQLIDKVRLVADLEFADNGFSGGGSLSLMGAAGIGLFFHYYKLSNGVDVGAKFEAPSQFTVPIGIAAWDKITGSFNFNTSDNIYSISAGGRISLVGVSNLLALTEAAITITSAPPGPILKGSANATVLDSWDIGYAEATIDFGNKYFYTMGKFGAGFNLIKGLGCTNEGSVTASASAASDPYIFVAGSTTMSLAHIFSSNVYVAGGWNAPTTADPSLAAVPASALYNGRIYGAYFNAHSSIGIAKADAPSIGFKDIAYIKAWYSNESDITVFGNVKSNTYGFSYAQNWDAGAEADFIGLSIASASIQVGGALNAAYNGNWAIAGTLNGSINAHIGCDGGCNGITWGCCVDPCFWSSCPICICPCGGKICGSASVSVGYTSQSGFSFDPSFF